jgi:hypothetical protein
MGTFPFPKNCSSSFLGYRLRNLGPELKWPWELVDPKVEPEEQEQVPWGPRLGTKCAVNICRMDQNKGEAGNSPAYWV